MIRDYVETDLPALKAIHATQGFDYRAPNLADPLYLVKKVRVVDGKVVAGCFLRLTAETFLLVDGNSFEKGRAIEELQPEVLQEAYIKGLDDIFCVIPPEIAENFAPALEKIGWSKDRAWPMYSKELNGPK